MTRPIKRIVGVSLIASLDRQAADPATFRIATLRHDLKPFKFHWFPALGSTNTHAARMRREGRLLAPAVVLTGRQTAGRGRGGNVWHAPRGVITVTFALPAHDTLPPQHVPLMVGLALHEALDEAGATDVGIKWPNDLWHRGRKLAGILCERIDGIDLIGVGLNANVAQAAFRPSDVGLPISLHDIVGRPVDQTDLVVRLAHLLRQASCDSRTSLAAALPRLRALDVLRGRVVRVSQTGEADIVGTADGFDAGGRLLVTTRGERLPIVSGTVRLLDR